MQTIALLSGLIGALVSAALGFVVRLVLDKRAQREAERKLAYVYLVRVSDIVAIDVAARVVAKIFLPAEAEKELMSADGSFEVAHKICAMLAEQLKKLDADAVKNDPALRVIPRWTKSVVDAVKQSQLTPEQLSKLPREAVFASNRFQGAQTYAAQVVDLWGALFENGESYWATAEGLHDQWTAVVRFTEAARLLRAELIRYGAADSREAHKLLTQQTQFIYQMVSKKRSEKPKLQAAEAALKKAVDSASAV